MRACEPITEWTITLIVAAILDARPGIHPSRLVRLARKLADYLPPARKPRRVARIIQAALDGAGGKRWERAMLNRFVLSYRIEWVPAWAQEALTDWQFGRRRHGSRHPWIEAECARRLAPADASTRRGKGRHDAE